MGADEQRSRLDHGGVLWRLHPGGAGIGDAHRPCRCKVRIPLRRRHDGCRAPAVRTLCGRILVCDGGARADRRRLGRNVHDRPQASGRPRRRQTAVARDGGPRGEHRCFRRAVFCLCRSHREHRRMARSLHCRERQCRPRGTACRLRGAAWRPTSAHDREQRSVVRFSARLSQSLGHGLCDRLRGPYARNERPAGMGCRLSGVRRRRCQFVRYAPFRPR